ncbi:mannosyltransferase [Mycolicibacillus parakoreensis]|uniref:Mannosyltransferase n=1 Tax=Mycolicibacillus parakoreensis TaxID=1069221 RepID=A0ABY3U8Q1_9MYCO|nr:mannosyltransferase [Mycolicibacillus parakoreensis]MCV7315053.1 mannosyltransferase [Mycolicibacillus parakoreensis]ULN54462.1 mannosyltransferase [Mycolicibacillus parakoreensis]
MDALTKVRPIDTTPASASPVWQRRAPLLAAMLLALSVVARLAWIALVPHGTNFVDLHVYIDGAAALDTPGTLYDYVYRGQTRDFDLPFTYPPFAALVFYPLHLLPFAVVAAAWQAGTVVALYAAVRVSQRLLGVVGARPAAMAWTAVMLWIEPVRSTLNYGQINVLLMLATLVAVFSRRSWLSGLLVGVAAGIKLTPAVAVVYFLGARRWAAAVLTALVFAGTVAVSYLLVGDAARRYFTTLLGDADRVGPIGTAFNQSWRGALSRILGHDAGYGPLVLVAIAVTAVTAVLAWRALGADDRLGRLLVVELVGLLVSPISWSHHWVWLVPLIIWLFHGPARHRWGARVLGWGWLAVTLLGVPWVLSFAQSTIWQISRPWHLAWAALAYLAAALGTMAWMALTAPRDTPGSGSARR